MQCRSCGTSLPTDATVCPNCQAATPYNAPTTSSESDINPYENEGLLSSSEVSTLAENPAHSSTSPYSQTETDLNVYQSTPTLIREDGQPEVKVPQTIEATPAPTYAQPTFYQQSSPTISQPVATTGYGTGESGASGQINSVAIPTTPIRQPGSTKLRSWFILLTMGMCIIVAGLALYPVLRGVHPMQGPSGNKVYTEAALIITELKTINIDQQTATVTPATTFKAKKTFYVYVGVNANNFDFNRYIGYYLVSLYIDGKAQGETQVKRVDPTQLIVIPAMVQDPGKVTLEAYWCTTNDCSDQELARFTEFTVTA